jgi:hypothetical protein
MSQKCVLQNLFCISKHAEFDADFESVEKNKEIKLRKMLQAENFGTPVIKVKNKFFHHLFVDNGFRMHNFATFVNRFEFGMKFLHFLKTYSVFEKNKFCLYSISTYANLENVKWLKKTKTYFFN